MNFNSLDKKCPDPPEPHWNGGEYDWDADTFRGGKTLYGTIITYR